MAKEFKKEELAEVEGQYKIRPQTDKEKEKFDTPEDIPAYRVKLDLSEEDKTRLTEEFTEEFKAIQAERKSKGLESKWKEADRLYAGTMARNNKLVFNLHCQNPKVKADAVVRALNESTLDSRPIIDVTPRPQEWASEEKSAVDTCEKQQQFIDYAMEEEIKPEHEFCKINACAVKKYVGIAKLTWDYEKEKRKREEVYEGENVPVLDDDGKPKLDPQTQQTIIRNEGLEEFIKSYKDAEKRYPQYVKRLSEGKEARIVVEYLDTLANNPRIVYVPIENFFVRNSTNGYKGLCKARLVVELLPPMSWWELKKKEENGEFEDVDRLIDKPLANDKPKPDTIDNYKTREYDVLEATMHFAEGDEDGEEVKIKAWFYPEDAEMTKFILMGSINFPWYGFDSDYVPHYVKLSENDGFYGDGKSVLMDLKDSAIAQNAMLNLSLHTVYIRNILTPIVPEGSELEQMFLENRWVDGKPLPVDDLFEDVSKGISFVQYPQVNMADFQMLGAQLQRIDDKVTGINEGMSGKENPSDPRAPAAKTQMLLQMSGVNIKDFIRTYVPSFNILVGNILQLYYQMSQSGRKFKVGTLSKEVTGMDVFQTISRDQMIAKTNIQARASSFAFDKVNEKTENMAMFQVISQSPMAQIQPDLYFKALRILLKCWSPTWRGFAEVDLMSPDKFNQQQFQKIMQALGMIIQQMSQQTQATGVQPKFDIQKVVQEVTAQVALQSNSQLADRAKQGKAHEPPQ